VNAGRAYDEQRREQGFRSQAHLDAFYASHDHTQACAVCSSIGGYAPYDDGMQPYMNQCEMGRSLYAASLCENFAPRDGKAVR
jgi:hypothetical protein